jgi:hypothetical protein
VLANSSLEVVTCKAQPGAGRCFLALRVFIRLSVTKREREATAEFLNPLIETHGKDKLHVFATKLQSSARSESLSGLCPVATALLVC